MLIMLTFDMILNHLLQNKVVERSLFEDKKVDLRDFDLSIISCKQGIFLEWFTFFIKTENIKTWFQKNVQNKAISYQKGF